MSESLYQFEAVIEPVPDKGGAFVRVPFDIRKEFGQGRVKVEATFNGVPYCGSIVNMGGQKPRWLHLLHSGCSQGHSESHGPLSW